MNPITITCFKAYDVRGKLGSELNQEVAYRIGRAFAEFLNAKRLVVGSDVRPTSHELKQAVIEGMIDAGADVIDLGMTGSEEVYFATGNMQADGGIEVTASHNPIDYNGLKMVRREARPIGKDSGLSEIRALAESGNFKSVETKGQLHHIAEKTQYVEHLLSLINVDALAPLKIVVNPGNGSAGPALDLIESELKRAKANIEFVKVHFEPDGSFPHGIPNPMLEANRTATSEAVVAHKADFGVAFDGDFDRCFFFDEHGSFIEGYYVVGLLADAFLSRGPSKIVYDPRLVWNTEKLVSESGGTPVMSPSGHSYMKAVMREAGAVYGGEMSAHHYFKDFYYCDSGMIPWLLVAELVSKKSLSLGSLVASYISSYPSPGEINFKLSDLGAKEVLANIEAHYADQNPKISRLDGLSMEFDTWRFNLRASNTEPLLRLNLETKADASLMQAKRRELTAFIETQGGTEH